MYHGVTLTQRVSVFMFMGTLNNANPNTLIMDIIQKSNKKLNYYISDYYSLRLN